MWSREGHGTGGAISISGQYFLGVGIISDVNSCSRLCGLVVKVSGYRSRGPGFDSRPYQIFWEVGSLERGPLSLVRTTEELHEWKSSGSDLENRY
jgi:hypothetical protein